MAYLLSHENEHELCSFCRFSGLVVRRPNRSEKDRHLCRWDERIRRNPSQNATFFTKSEHTIKRAVALSSPVSTVYARNAWVFTSLLMSLRSLRLGSNAVLHMSGTQFNQLGSCEVRRLIQLSSTDVIWSGWDVMHAWTAVKNAWRPTLGQTPIFTWAEPNA